MNAEAKDLGVVAALGLCGQHGGVDLEEDVVEGGAEVGAVDDGVARRLGVVEVFAAGAVELDGGRVGHVRLAHGEERLRFAHDAGALAEVGFFEFLELGVVMWLEYNKCTEGEMGVGGLGRRGRIGVPF